MKHEAESSGVLPMQGRRFDMSKAGGSGQQPNQIRRRSFLESHPAGLKRVLCVTGDDKSNEEAKWVISSCG